MTLDPISNQLRGLLEKLNEYSKDIRDSIRIQGGITRKMLIISIVIAVLSVGIIILAIITAELSMVASDDIKLIKNYDEKRFKIENFPLNVTFSGEPTIVKDGNYSNAPLPITLSISAISPHYQIIKIERAHFEEDPTRDCLYKIKPYVSLSNVVSQVIPIGATNFNFDVPLKFDYAPKKIDAPSSNSTGVFVSVGNIKFEILVYDMQDNTTSNYTATSSLTIQRGSSACISIVDTLNLQG